MTNTRISLRTPWSPGDTIRYTLEPDHLAFVTYVNKFHTQAVQLTSEIFKIPFVILEFDYDKWKRDLEIEFKERDDSWNQAASF